ncbi:spore photoproduct lyase family protein [Nonomuraea sp. WAC 01424]|uniref:spore photoproduct lyase family protein n=1 Tax=Nonomuraea sp. WAC 01424 TaxID=2203200 RepID=UPI000F7695AB|nr:spore photoproduct lyase family protein [Nonomuraea sp. WAC 01424]RSN04783.1 spore photoproduct lyase family protein [Nonomuraea sp. WAC 01424]
MSALLDIRRVYVEPEARPLPRGREILGGFPGAEIVEVESHHRIPELYGDEANVACWVRIKTEALVLGVKKSLTARPNGRSADFIAPSTANGCAMACAYCYVPRRKGYSNPITVFANIDQITGYVRDLVELFRGLPNAKAGFATKYVNRDLLGWDPQGRTRVRFSLMPAADSKLLDRLGDTLSAEARAQLAAEVIFLTHNDRLHQVNLGWHPKAEEVLWRPELQQAKRSETGGWNVRHRNGHKGGYVAALTGLLAARPLFCRIRYAF